ncbi:hypothetical protein G8B32_13425 [Enterococcus faecalis]|nr:hypothetical protein [Enterococcus faecalis]
MNKPDPASANTPVQVELQPKDMTNEPVTPPNTNIPEVPDPDNPGNNKPGTGGGDNGTTISGTFGIAYAPGKLVNKDTKVELGKNIEADGSQNIALKTYSDDGSKDNVDYLNVGVRDTTSKTGRSWTLSAQLSWTGDNVPGSSIKASGVGQVTENNKGSLIQTSKITNDVDGKGDLVIGTNAATNIMSAKADQVMAGTYNYGFVMPKLVLENPSNVAAGTYKGNIVWSLSNAVQGGSNQP